MSSFIQTILSVSEFHRFSTEALADYTAGRGSHPALKIPMNCAYTITRKDSVVKMCQICYDTIMLGPEQTPE